MVLNPPNQYESENDDAIRRELAELINRTARGLDENRPEAVAQRNRRPHEELLVKTPADGLIAGIGSVNRQWFGEENARCMVMAYDYTVLAGTQGHFSL